MTQELKDKWIAALRSGHYSQAKHTLKSEEGFCCLGVLCDIIDPSKWSGETNDIGETVYTFPSGRTDTCVLPMSDRNDLNLGEAFAMQDGVVYTVDSRPHDAQIRCLADILMTLNDDYSSDFNHIADVIEKHLPVSE